LDVFFYELNITHTPSPIIQEDHYYPYGLSMRGTGKQGNNRYLYNQGTGERKFKTERVADLGLNLDMTKFRMYDYALGRFWQVDSKTDFAGQESWTPYQYGFNNPIRYNHPLGDCIPCGLINAGVDVLIQSAEIALDDSKTINDFSFGSVGVSFLTGSLGFGLVSKVGKAAKLLDYD